MRAETGERRHAAESESSPEAGRLRFESSSARPAGDKLKFEAIEDPVPEAAPWKPNRSIGKPQGGTAPPAGSPVSPVPPAAGSAAAAGAETASAVRPETGRIPGSSAGSPLPRPGSPAEPAAEPVRRSSYSQKLSARFGSVRKLGDSGRQLFSQGEFRENPDPSSGDPGEPSEPSSRGAQRWQIRQGYARSLRAGLTGVRGTESVFGSGTGFRGEAGTREQAGGAGQAVRERESGSGRIWAVLLLCAAVFLVLMCFFSSCTILAQGTAAVVLETSYTAEDEDILAVDADYTALEAELRERVSQTESLYPGYDEYRYQLDEIGHNPFELASLLTVLYEDYTEEEVLSLLPEILESQYILTIEEQTEIRTRTEEQTVTDPETGETVTSEAEAEYTWRILTITLENRGLAQAAGEAGLTEEQMERYAVLMETLGNKSYLFADSIYAVPSEGSSYQIPAEALTDEVFARMIQEAEKYLGYPYVWGGSSPSTGFDCSGYVSWVINHCGNGWSVGRLTANGLLGICTVVSPSEARPGDLVFFQGTYDASGASHVGIYVGDGMMIHCGNPVQYTSINTSYWQEHLLCFGRLP